MIAFDELERLIKMWCHDIRLEEMEKCLEELEKCLEELEKSAINVR